MNSAIAVVYKHSILFCTTYYITGSRLQCVQVCNENRNILFTISFFYSIILHAYADSDFK